MSDTNDVSLLTFLGVRDRVFRLPSYERGLLEKYYQLDDALNDEKKIRRSVMKKAGRRKPETTGKHQQDDIDSNPRGYALLINNNKFYDDQQFPERLGSENDVRSIQELLKHLHCSIQVFQNLTKAEMEREVENFSRKPELNNVGRNIIALMSHKEEGETESDTQIIGVDGLGLKMEKIYSYFQSDTCKALTGKPKVFIFQVCRPEDDICRRYRLCSAMRARTRVS